MKYNVLVLETSRFWVYFHVDVWIKSSLQLAYSSLRHDAFIFFYSIFVVYTYVLFQFGLQVIWYKLVWYFSALNYWNKHQIYINVSYCENDRSQQDIVKTMEFELFRSQEIMYLGNSKEIWKFNMLGML